MNYIFLYGFFMLIYKYFFNVYIRYISNQYNDPLVVDKRDNITK
jgi:hypothetical protein